MKGEARNSRYGYPYRQQPYLVTHIHYPHLGGGLFDFTSPQVTQWWRGINTKKFKTRKDCLRHGYK